MAECMPTCVACVCLCAFTCVCVCVCVCLHVCVHACIHEHYAFWHVFNLTHASLLELCYCRLEEEAMRMRTLTRMPS